MILLGILLNQFAYWRSWVTEEKLWRKITVVSFASLTVLGSFHDLNTFLSEGEGEDGEQDR